MRNNKKFTDIPSLSSRDRTVGNVSEKGLDEIMVKPMSRLEREIMFALSTRTDYEYQKRKKKRV